jgi:hypothetical protein
MVIVWGKHRQDLYEGFSLSSRWFTMRGNQNLSSCTIHIVFTDFYSLRGFLLNYGMTYYIFLLCKRDQWLNKCEMIFS